MKRSLVTQLAHIVIRVATLLPIPVIEAARVPAAGRGRRGSNLLWRRDLAVCHVRWHGHVLRVLVHLVLGVMRRMLGTGTTWVLHITRPAPVSSRWRRLRCSTTWELTERGRRAGLLPGVLLRWELLVACRLLRWWWAAEIARWTARIGRRRISTIGTRTKVATIVRGRGTERPVTVVSSWTVLRRSRPSVVSVIVLFVIFMAIVIFALGVAIAIVLIIIVSAVLTTIIVVVFIASATISWVPRDGLHKVGARPGWRLGP